MATSSSPEPAEGTDWSDGEEPPPPAKKTPTKWLQTFLQKTQKRISDEERVDALQSGMPARQDFAYPSRASVRSPSPQRRQAPRILLQAWAREDQSCSLCSHHIIGGHDRIGKRSMDHSWCHLACLKDQSVSPSRRASPRRASGGAPSTWREFAHKYADKEQDCSLCPARVKHGDWIGKRMDHKWCHVACFDKEGQRVSLRAFRSEARGF